MIDELGLRLTDYGVGNKSGPTTRNTDKTHATNQKHVRSELQNNDDGR